MNNILEELLKTPRMGVRSNINSKENNLKGLLDFIKYYDLSDKNVVELGCYIGVSTELFAMFCKQITSIDLWGLDKTYDGGENLNSGWIEIEKMARERLLPYKNATLIRANAEEYSKNFDNESIDLLYIDANHSYEYVKKDIECWFEKVKKGGIMSGHDYGIEGVKLAAEEFYINHGLKEFKVFPDTSWGMIK